MIADVIILLIVTKITIRATLTLTIFLFRLVIPLEMLKIYPVAKLGSSDKSHVISLGLATRYIGNMAVIRSSL